jgi:deazaflavin-dependent oxidoreductase (nitroreductase family)
MGPTGKCLRGLTELTTLAILVNNVSLVAGFTGEEQAMDASTNYKEPGHLVKMVMNPLVSVMLKAGISVWGARTLEVPGRKSGELRRNPVNLLHFEGDDYLVSPRGNGQWVRNVRAANGRLALLLGHRREELIAHELSDAEKTPVLRAYLARWKMEVGVFFDGVSADSPEEDVQRIASNHPVFRLSPGWN